ncbi:MAG TPA: glucose-6-phosphate dehydrogenase assembly protein OpcA [Candidatus Angelobacter sp.]|nr:glucose-6-phosphate dehydrogenase assembly protein OpcA [Candidatus Angelobacter sp.]
MSVRLDDTTASQVSLAIDAERFRQGSSAVGRVLTLVIVADEATQADAVRAAAEAAREHPCRILTAIPRPGRGPARLDAEITVGGADGLGELAELRLRGPLSHHVASVVLPLLVPDAPVVVWWPGAAPDDVSADPVGRLAQRRITDASAARSPLRALDTRRETYGAGDTDLAWTRITPWRSLIASTLDQPFGHVTGASISVQRGNPSGALLASWLQHGLDVAVELHHSRGPGITGVTVHTDRGDISITRPDGRVARMVRPGFPDREAALHRRSVEALIAEELRRLDPDEIYGETLDGLTALADWEPRPAGGRAAAPAGARRAASARVARSEPAKAATTAKAAQPAKAKPTKPTKAAKAKPARAGTPTPVTAAKRAAARGTGAAATARSTAGRTPARRPGTRAAARTAAERDPGEGRA